MRLLEITTFYPNYLKEFYRINKGLIVKDYTSQRSVLLYDAFGWADFYQKAFQRLGYETFGIILNAEHLQRQWAREKSIKNYKEMNLNSIALWQIKEFKPDVLFYLHWDKEFLLRIKKEVPSINIVIGWSGSAIIKTDIWQYMNIVFSCAPEVVFKLRKNGVNAFHLNHAFEPDVNNRIKYRKMIYDISFMGSLLLMEGFHQNRIKTIEALTQLKKIAVFSPQYYDYLFMQRIKRLIVNLVKNGILHIVNKAKQIKLFNNIINHNKLLERVEYWHNTQDLYKKPHNNSVSIFPPGYGLKMYQTVRNSYVSLNIHADSSPEYASNVRLFEVPGVGGCLLTDWKKNINDLFEPDIEIVVYKNVDECIEKARWLLENKKETERIGLAGLKRIAKDHTFYHRAQEIDSFIKQNI
jgi:spore maturation protein CgeB